ncbi:hypothetical protein H0H81_005536, partial [Sphagnurus paluster]
MPWSAPAKEKAMLVKLTRASTFFTPSIHPEYVPMPTPNLSIMQTLASLSLSTSTAVKPMPFTSTFNSSTSQMPSATSSVEHVPSVSTLYSGTTQDEGLWLYHMITPTPARICRMSTYTVPTTPSSTGNTPISYLLLFSTVPLLVPTASSEANAIVSITMPSPATPAVEPIRPMVPGHCQHMTTQPAAPFKPVLCHPLPVEHVRAAMPTKLSATAEPATTPPPPPAAIKPIRPST